HTLPSHLLYLPLYLCLSPNLLPHCLSSLFFFHSYGHNRHLHSFPTRRSSDLPEGYLKSSSWSCSFSNCKISSARYPVLILQFEKDRKSTRLNSSHVAISYAVFCLKKKIKPIDTYKDMETRRTGIENLGKVGYR